MGGPILNTLVEARQSDVSAVHQARDGAYKDFIEAHIELDKVESNFEDVRDSVLEGEQSGAESPTGS